MSTEIPSLKGRSAPWVKILYRWISPFVDVRKATAAFPGAMAYVRDWREYRRLPGAQLLTIKDAYPCLHDRTVLTPFDSHYLHVNAWAARRIARSPHPAHHVDVGSQVIFVGILSANVKVVFVDVRPARMRLDNLACVGGDLCSLPFASNSLPSVSCLHVAEHVGLGRYGDQLDPEGTVKAARELARVVAPGGRLYFAIPVGKSRVCFNAHRVHDPEEVRAWFGQYDLIEFSGVTDAGRFVEKVGLAQFRDSEYALGMYLLVKRHSSG